MISGAALCGVIVKQNKSEDAFLQDMDDVDIDLDTILDAGDQNE